MRKHTTKLENYANLRGFVHVESVIVVSQWILGESYLQFLDKPNCYVPQYPLSRLHPLDLYHFKKSAAVSCISLSCTSSSSAAAWTCEARFQGLLQNPTKKPSRLG